MCLANKNIRSDSTMLSKDQWLVSDLTRVFRNKGDDLDWYTLQYSIPPKVLIFVLVPLDLGLSSCSYFCLSVLKANTNVWWICFICSHARRNHGEIRMSCRWKRYLSSLLPKTQRHYFFYSCIKIGDWNLDSGNNLSSGLHFHKF